MIRLLAATFALAVWVGPAFGQDDAQEIARLDVTLDGRFGDLGLPVSIDLDAVTFVPDSVLALVAIRDDERVPIPFQIRHGLHRTLHWLAAPGSQYVLQRGSAHAAPTDAVAATADDGLLTISADGTPLLGYQFGLMPAPDTVDAAFARSGFIHPLRTPSGKLLTRIQPSDHYHHYGLWNPWTQTEYEGRVVDFWNLAKHEGTVRFGGFASISEGPAFGEFQALHEHVVFDDGGEEVALNELQTVRVYRPDEDGYYVIDFTSALSAAGEKPLRLLEYRYGGLGWRGPEGWTDETSEMITSEGRTRADADASTARWIRVQGERGDAEAGMLLMSHPANYNHPEPLRVWPPGQHDHGDVFVNFSPTKNTDWLLEPGRRYALRYRFVVFDGQMTAERAEQFWQAFAHPPQVEISGTGTASRTGPSVESGAYAWEEQSTTNDASISRSVMLQGATRDLESLRVTAVTAEPAAEANAHEVHADHEELIIVKEGTLRIGIDGETRELGPGSTAVILPGESHRIANAGPGVASWYAFTYRSKAGTNAERAAAAGGSFVVDWDDVVFQPSETGGRRQNFDRPTSMLSQFEMHVSTLNGGLTNHATHTHRAEEMVVVIRGDVEMEIGETRQTATAGDVYFIGSEVPHSLRNLSDSPAEYFAFQWR